MIPHLRRAFNERWTPGQYATLLDLLAAQAGGAPAFPVSETPCFFERGFIEDLAETGRQLVEQINADPAAVAASEAAVPVRFSGPNEEAVPKFVQVDFGLVRTADGVLEPRLVELQAFPSLYGLQRAMAEAYRQAFGLPDSLGIYLGDLDAAGYDALIGSAIRGDHDPAEVVLMEIEPRRQKTWADFAVTESVWGVRPVDTSDIMRAGRELFYDRDGRRTRIRRIYNRVIPDELERRGIELPFDFRDDLDVEWVGHPAWFFRLSKVCLPYLTDPCVPRARFLNQIERMPSDRERYVLKPLFSFAGGGIRFAPTDADIAAIPIEDRAHYILQDRVWFAPVIPTPEGPTQVEIRIMYVWADELRPVMPLLRMGRGTMMGVDQNKGLRWVGASAAFLEERP
jgi:hypothetical protein